MSTGFALQLWLDGRPGSQISADTRLQRFSHRVSDRRAALVDGPLELTVAERWATPGSEQAPQPRASLDGRYLVVLDGRLDYVDDLRRSLRLDGHPADVDLVGAAYSRGGEDAFVRLEGEFVAVVWDRRERTLVIARSAVVGPPCYYEFGPHSFSASTEVQQLVRDRPETPRVNEAMLAEMLTGFGRHPTETLYEGIVRLDIARVLRVRDRGAPAIRRYWDLEIPDELHLPDRRDYVAAWWSTVSDAVSSRFRSLGTLGFDLSGGLDSSSLTTVASTVADGRPWAAFTFGFAPDSPAYETPWATAVAQAVDAPHTVVDAQCVDVGALNRQTSLLCEPQYASEVSADLLLNEAARLCNVRIRVGGFAGDEVWGWGADPVWGAVRHGKWSAARDAMAARHRQAGWRAAAHATFLTPLLWRATRDAQEGRSAAYRGRLLSPALRRTTHISERLYPKSDRTWPEKRWSSGLCFLLSRNLGSFPSDAASAASDALRGVERTSPFTDRRVLAFALALPSELRRCGSWDRVLLRAAVGEILPNEAVWRESKRDLSDVLRTALLALQRDGREFGRTATRLGWVDKERVAEAVASLESNCSRDLTTLYALASVESWYEIVVENNQNYSQVG